jgi:hypothetical protein
MLRRCQCGSSFSSGCISGFGLCLSRFETKHRCHLLWQFSEKRTNIMSFQHKKRTDQRPFKSKICDSCFLICFFQISQCPVSSCCRIREGFPHCLEDYTLLSYYHPTSRFWLKNPPACCAHSLFVCPLTRKLPPPSPLPLAAPPFSPCNSLGLYKLPPGEVINGENLQKKQFWGKSVDQYKSVNQRQTDRVN